MRNIIPLLAVFVGVGAWIFPWVITVQAEENNPPTIVSVVTAVTANGQSDSFPSGSIDLIAGTTRSVYVNGVVEDLDGKATISSVSGTLHRSGAPSGENCTVDAAQCYRVGSCALGDNADPNQKTFSCRMDVQYIAQSTVSGGQFPNEHWVAYVYVTDGQAFQTNTATTKEMQSLMSLSIPASIPFGARSLYDESTSGNNVEMVLTQRGNTEADVEVSMSGPLSCASGSIPRANIKWSITDVGYTSGAATSMTGSPADTNVYVAYGTDGNLAPTKTLYWNIAIPEGVGGYCANTVTISALTH